MTQQIIRQPDGHYAVFSSVTDTITMYDATADEIVDEFVQREAQRTREHVERILEHVAAGTPDKIYFQFAMTWEQALNMDREHGGDAWREAKR